MHFATTGSLPSACELETVPFAAMVTWHVTLALERLPLFRSQHVRVTPTLRLFTTASISLPLKAAVPADGPPLPPPMLGPPLSPCRSAAMLGSTAFAVPADGPLPEE